MKSYVIYCIAAAVIAWAFSFSVTPLARIFAYSIKALDIPKDARRVHKKTTPLLGGLAIWFGFMAASILFCAITKEALSMWVGATALIVVGVVDDRFGIHAVIKFLLQIIIATGTVIWGNFGLEQIKFFGSEIPFDNVTGTVLSVFWIVALINAINLIDGLDGLACGISCIGATTILIISIIYSNTYMALFSAILVGACAGFLPYNFNPAKIFMGDTGSMFLGYILALMSIQGSMKMNYSLLAFITPVAVFGLPILDTAFAFTRRILQGRSPFSADRGHLHHRLLDMGFTQKQTVFIMYLISFTLGMSAIMFALRNVVPENHELMSYQRLTICSCGILVLGVVLFVIELLLFRNRHARRHSGLGLPKDESDSNCEDD